MKKLVISILSMWAAVSFAQNKILIVSTGVSGTMMHFSLYEKQQDGSFSLKDQADEDSGTWMFDSLSDGTYRVHVDIAYNKYLPTWYPGAAIWDMAQDITVSVDSQGVAVQMLPNTALVGPASITGLLNEGVLKAEGEPLKDTRVVINTDNDVFVTMVSTNDSGRFTVTGLPVGSYKILADVVNASTANPKTVELDSNNLTASVDLTVNQTGTVNTGLFGAQVQYGIHLYPNPVEHTLYIDGAERGEVSVYSVRGELVHTTSFAGCGVIDMSDMEKGLYLIRVTHAGNDAKTYRVLKN